MQEFKKSSSEYCWFDGRFAINNIQADNSLIIGCFGYKTQTIKPDFTSEMIVKLAKEPNFS